MHILYTLMTFVCISADWTSLMAPPPKPIDLVGEFSSAQRQAMETERVRYEFNQNRAADRVLYEVIQQDGSITCDSIIPSARRNNLELQRAMALIRMCYEYNKQKSKE